MGGGGGGSPPPMIIPPPPSPVPRQPDIGSPLQKEVALNDATNMALNGRDASNLTKKRGTILGGGGGDYSAKTLG